MEGHKSGNHKATNLLYFRIRKGMTLQDLSGKTGLSTATLHRLERGLIGLTERSKIKLMDTLGASEKEVHDLLKETHAAQLFRSSKSASA